MTTTEPAIAADTRVQLYCTAVRILAFDEKKYRSAMLSGKVGGMYYSARGGQEFAAASVAAHLEPSDYMVTTYRGVHDQIAKGAPLRELWAEHMAKSPAHVTAREVRCMCRRPPTA